MSKFYVGQRVRIKWSRGWPELGGCQGTIVGRATTDGIRGNAEWVVHPDMWECKIAPHPSNMGGRIFAPHSSQLEPLQPERNQTIEWSECVWKPEHMRAEA